MNSVEAKFRHSKQRERIYEYLCSAKSHPSAEMIYDDLRSEMPNLSLGTVYRNLRMLEEIGKVIRVTAVDGHERYDAICENHAHFVCEKCGCVSDLSVLNEDQVAKLCNVDDDSVIHNVRVVIGGICSQCPRSE